MKNLNLYQQIQIAILLVFLLMFVVTATMMLTQPTPPEVIKTLFGELKNLFLTLLSIKGLGEAITRSNGGVTHEEIAPVVTIPAP